MEPRPFVGPAGRRKLFLQEVVDPLFWTSQVDRAEALGKLAKRAADWFADQPSEVDWLTLEFRIHRTGMEATADREAWRWEVWTKA